MARGQWTAHTADCQREILDMLADQGGSASIEELYKLGAWGIRTATVKALIRKGKVKCEGSDIWRDRLTIQSSPNAIR